MTSRTTLRTVPEGGEFPYGVHLATPGGMPQHARNEVPEKKVSLPKAELLFAGLDGRDLLVSGQAWHLEVYGICEDAGRRWIQIAVDGPHHYMLTLALATRSGVRQAVTTLSNWLENPAETHQVLNVT